MINNFYKKLKALKSLEPNEQTNKIFSELCEYSIKSEKNIKVNKKVLEINKICAEAEFEMEKFWANKIIKSKNPKKELENFIYFNNYQKLTNLEFINVKLFQEKIYNVLFIGGGPLPLTAIILAKEFGVNCKIVDYSTEAINLAKELIEKLELKSKITFEKKDILDYKDEKKYDLVYAASLIFGIKEQEEIIKNISNLNFSKILVRTSHKSRKLLYKKTDENILKKYFKKELIVHPKNDIVNSFIILTKK